jgi:VCBS repeat-containing protein
VGPQLWKKEQRKQVRQALNEGRNVKAKFTVRATDAAGNVATAKRTITLVK